MTHSTTIAAIRKKLGNDLAILAHHYQHDDVVKHADITGDSLELSRKIPTLGASSIVFCGVYFMAESGAILANTACNQQVYTPAPDAACVMSEMAPSTLVETVLSNLMASDRKLIPLTYVNSPAAVKAICGKLGGTVCTSANAPTMLQWALDRGDGVVFLPDQNLAKNTANKLGLDARQMHTLDIRKGGTALDLEAAAKADLLLWPGCCAIHARIRPSHVTKARTDVDAKIIVHPECSPEVVNMADGAGSTSYIIKYVEEAPEGSHIVVGTEINLVNRLTAQYAGRKTITPLLQTGCSNMAKTTEERLATLLNALDPDSTANSIPLKPTHVFEHEAHYARIALERMLEACK